MNELRSVQSEIEQARAELAGSVDALAARLDVRGRARRRLAQARSRVAANKQSAAVVAGGAVLALLILERARRSRRS